VVLAQSALSENLGGDISACSWCSAVVIAFMQQQSSNDLQNSILTQFIVHVHAVNLDCQVVYQEDKLSESARVH
jgi:hypothetical protein